MDHQYSPLLDFLLTQGYDVLARQFENTVSCYGVFQLLPEISKLVILKLLFLSTPAAGIPLLDFFDFFQSSQDNLSPSETPLFFLDILYELKILLFASYQDALVSDGSAIVLTTGYIAQNQHVRESSSFSHIIRTDAQTTGHLQNKWVHLNPLFGSRLKASLTRPPPHIESLAHQTLSKESIITAAQLSKFSEDVWDCIMKYMLKIPALEEELDRTEAADCLLPEKSKHAYAENSVMIGSFIKSAQLIRGYKKREKGSFSLTTKGFNFILATRYEQLWEFIKTYIRYLNSRNIDVAETLLFLLHISHHPVGIKCPLETAVSDSIQLLIDEFSETAILYKTSDGYYTTPLASLLSSKPGLNIDTLKRNQYIITESNNHLYAYTTDQIEIHLLKTFAETHSTFPGLVVGVITKESAQAAFRNGITSKQIIHFLSTYAHPAMYKHADAHGDASGGASASEAHDGFAESSERYELASTTYRASSISDKTAYRSTIIPHTVISQLQLWERERDRLEIVSAKLYTFSTKERYEETLHKITNTAAGNSEPSLLWNSPKTFKFVIKLSASDQAADKRKRAPLAGSEKTRIKTEETALQDEIKKEKNTTPTG